ncbi:eukaryotic translation initiation factor 4G1-domain-containing protein [Trametes gibbosa]|nr:eukaryotic translation initiation factor 4G1-domain-containing protein [Trametes gibbosa]
MSSSTTPRRASHMPTVPQLPTTASYGAYEALVPLPYYMPQPRLIPSVAMEVNRELPSYYPPFLPTTTLAMPQNASERRPTSSPDAYIMQTPAPPTPSPSTFSPRSTASPFVPKRIIIKSESGKELDLERFRVQKGACASQRVVSSRPVPVRIESEDGRRQRLLKEAADRGEDVAELQARMYTEEQKKLEQGLSKKKPKVRRKSAKAHAKVNDERQRKETEERQRKETEERQRKETEERQRKETEEEVHGSLDIIDMVRYGGAGTEVSLAQTPPFDETSITSSIVRRYPPPVGLPPTIASFASALAVAQAIRNLGSVQYPEGFSVPTQQLNINALQGKFRYDRAFLLQFMSVCQEKPISLQHLDVPPLNAIARRPVGQFMPARHQLNAVDISQIAQVNQAPPMTLGPSSFYQKDRPKSRESTPLPQGSTNMYSPVSVGPGGAPNEAPQRRRLQLLPRAAPKSGTSLAIPTNPTTGARGIQEICNIGKPIHVEDANVRIQKDMAEFFRIRNLEWAEVYFTRLQGHRPLLVSNLVAKAIDAGVDEAKLVANLFDRAHSRKLCSPASFEEGFTEMAKKLDCIAIGNWKAMYLFATMVKGAHLYEDEERWARLAAHSVDSELLVSLLTS